MNSPIVRHRGKTFQAHKQIRQQHPRCNVQFLTAGMTDCSYECVGKAIADLKAGLSKVLRSHKTLGWVAAIEIDPTVGMVAGAPSKDSALFVHAHAHCMAWSRQYSALDVDAVTASEWQSVMPLGTQLIISQPLASAEDVKNTVYYLHKLPPFHNLRSEPELWDLVRPLLVGKRLVERHGMAASSRTQRAAAPIAA